MGTAFQSRVQPGDPHIPLPAGRRFSPVLIVFLVALALRLFVLCQVANTPEFAPDQGDMKFYNDWARRIAAGTLTDHQAFYGLPGYAYWLAILYKVVGFQPYVAALLQVFVEAATAAIIFSLASLAFDHKAADESPRRVQTIGALAAFGWIFFVPAQAYSSVLMPTCYLVAAFWFVVWWILRRREARPAARGFFGLGLLMGIVAMMVANILFLIPLVLAAVWLRREWSSASVKFTARARALASASLLAGILLGVSPCAYHNYVLAEEPVMLSAHSGINFYLGNNAVANGYPKIPSPLHADQQGMLRDSITWAERAVGHPLKRVEVSAFWSGLAHQYIHDHPLAWVRLLGTKLANFWNVLQYDDLGVIRSFQEDGVLLPGIGFGFVAILALPGLVIALLRRVSSSYWVIGAVGLHMASLLAVFVTERYRLAAVPGLLLLASYGVVEVSRGLLAHRWKLPVIYAAALALAALFVLQPSTPELTNHDDYNSALADMVRGHLDRAHDKLARVLAAFPDNAEANFAMGNLYLAKGDRDQAKRFYRYTLDLDPNHDRVLNNLGVLAIEEKRWPLAETFLSSALRIDPSDAKTNYLLAEARLGKRDLNGAQMALTEALRLQPAQPAFLKLNDQLATERAAATP